MSKTVDILKGGIGLGVFLSLLAKVASDFAECPVPQPARWAIFGIGFAIGAYVMWRPEKETHHG